MRPAPLDDEDLDLDPEVPLWTEDEYKDWREGTSRVVSGPLGRHAKFPGRRFKNWREAKKHVDENYSVIKFGIWGFRWFARIRKADASS